MKTINQNAPIKCKKSITINTDCKKVWSIMTDIDNWASWQTDISQPKLNGTIAPNSTFVWKTGGVKINSTLHTVNPYKQFGWTGKAVGMFAIHNWTISDVNGQTLVLVEESMEGFLSGLLKSSFNKNLERDMQHWLELLKRESEK